jgi:L-lactate dehydrogenase (cytochrome)
LNHPFFFQLYVDKNRAKSERLLREVGELGMRAIFVTVDAPVPGKREADERLHVDESLSSPISGVKAINDSKGGGIARVMGSFIDPGLSWTDIAWLRSCTNLPIVIKGIQTAEDARLALEHGVDGIVVSNHGGRSLDTSPAAIMVLLELQRRCPEVFKSMEVFLDGGIRRGTDVIKALCLGAKGVAVGRPFLYALTYGSDGIERLTEILKDEIETTLRLLGVTSLSQLHPGLLNTRHVDHLIPENYQESEAPSLQSKRVVAKKEIAKL